MNSKSYHTSQEILGFETIISPMPCVPVSHLFVFHLLIVWSHSFRSRAVPTCWWQCSDLMMTSHLQTLLLYAAHHLLCPHCPSSPLRVHHYGHSFSNSHSSQGQDSTALVKTGAPVLAWWLVLEDTQPCWRGPVFIHSPPHSSHGPLPPTVCSKCRCFCQRPNCPENPIFNPFPQRLCLCSDLSCSVNLSRSKGHSVSIHTCSRTS